MRINEILKEWKWAIVMMVVVLLPGLVWVIGDRLGGSGSIGMVGIFSALLDVIKVPFLVAFLFLSLRLRDRLGGIDWKMARDSIQASSMASAIYFGAWVVAVALIIAAS